MKIDKTESHTIRLMQSLEGRINMAYGNQKNIKITAREDIELFKGWVLFKGCEKS